MYDIFNCSSHQNTVACVHTTSTREVHGGAVYWDTTLVCVSSGISYRFKVAFGGCVLSASNFTHVHSALSSARSIARYYREEHSCTCLEYRPGDMVVRQEPFAGSVFWFTARYKPSFPPPSWVGLGPLLSAQTTVGYQTLPP